MAELMSLAWFILWVIIVLLAVGIVGAVVFGVWMMRTLNAEARGLRGRR
jgi:nitrate reductase NapE component